MQLEGMVFTQAGWVQSYGSRCVRPPIIAGDVAFVQPMTVREFKVAQVRGRAALAHAHAADTTACHMCIHALRSQHLIPANTLARLPTHPVPSPLPA